MDRFGDKVCCNPTVKLKKQELYSVIDIDQITPGYKTVRSVESIKYAGQGGAKFQDHDVLFARITPCLENGKIAKVNILYDNEVGFGSTEYIVFRAKEGVTDENFVYYLVCSPLIRDPAIKSMVGSSGRQRVQTDVIKNLEVSVPDIVTQRRIGSLLKSIDDKIAINTKINENLAQQAQAIYRSMFVSTPYESDRIGVLSELIAVKYGKDHKKLNDGIYPVYGSGGIMRYVEKPIYEKESVLIPRKGSLNNVMYIDEPFWSVDTMFYTEMKIANVAKYVFHFLRSKDLASLNAGSAVPSMTTDILNSMEVSIPSTERLADFENLVAPLYRVMKDNVRQSNNLSLLRDTLLPKLMSGDIDVSEVKI